MKNTASKKRGGKERERFFSCIVCHSSLSLFCRTDHRVVSTSFLPQNYFFSATFWLVVIHCLNTSTHSSAILSPLQKKSHSIDNQVYILPESSIISDLMMKADESNDSGLDIANGSLEEIKPDSLVVVDGDADSDKCSDSAQPSPIKSEANQIKSSNGSDTAISNLSSESQHSFLIAENKHRSRSDTEEKSDQERRSLDQLSPVDFRGLEQHQHVHAQNYIFASPSQQDYRAHHGYQQSVIMPVVPSQPYQNHSEWYPNHPLSINGSQDYTFVGHEGMFKMFIIVSKV